jgi:hypothetical protein
MQCGFLSAQVVAVISQMGLLRYVAMHEYRRAWSTCSGELLRESGCPTPCPWQC